MDRETTLEFHIVNRWADDARTLMTVVPATNSSSEEWHEVATFPGYASNGLIAETLGAALAPLIETAWPIVSDLPSGRV